MTETKTMRMRMWISKLTHSTDFKRARITGEPHVRQHRKLPL